jgi:hypothetical protein
VLHLPQQLHRSIDHIIVVPDMHGQNVVQVQEPPSLSDRNAEQPSQQ